MNFKKIFIRNYSMLFVLLACFSCQQEVEIEPVNAELSQLNHALVEALDLIGEDNEQALIFCDKVIENGIGQGADYQVGKAHWFKGYIFDVYKEDISQAYFNYRDALEYLAATDSSELKMSVHNNLGILYRQYGQYDAAIENYEQALKLSEALTPKQLSDLHYNLGVAYNLKGDPASFTLAESSLTKALELAEEITDEENIASVHNYIGVMYWEVGEYDVARIAYDNTIRSYENVAQDHPAREYVGKAYHGIGVTYMEEENYEAAIEAFRKALELKTTSSSIFVTKYDLGTVYHKMGDIETAVSVWKEAIKEKHNRLDREHVEIYARLTNALATEGSYEEAVGYAVEYNSQIQDILGSGEKYEIENNRILFADVIKEYAEFRKETPYYQTWWFISALLLGLAGGIYLIVYLQYRSKVNSKISENISRIKMEFDNIKLD